MSPPDFNRAWKHRHTAFYCEENIWHLLQEPDLRDFEKRVFIISNSQKKCRFWNQRACRSENEFVWWDYHVILLCKQEAWLVYDLDTRLRFPIDLDQYFHLTFQYPKSFRDPEDVLIRVVDSQEYSKNFTSDRSHMISPDGNWIYPPPPWPPILHSQYEHMTLAELIDIQSQNTWSVYTIPEVFERFSLANDSR